MKLKCYWQLQLFRCGRAAGSRGLSRALNSGDLLPSVRWKRAQSPQWRSFIWRGPSGNIFMHYWSNTLRLSPFPIIYRILNFPDLFCFKISYMKENNWCLGTEFITWSACPVALSEIHFVLKSKFKKLWH